MESNDIDILQITAPDESDYLFIHDRSHAVPFPSIMILKVVYEDGNIRIVDAEENDLQAAHYAIDHYLS